MQHNLKLEQIVLMDWFRTNIIKPVFYFCFYFVFFLQTEVPSSYNIIALLRFITHWRSL